MALSALPTRPSKKNNAEISNEQNSIRYLASNISSLVDINIQTQELFSLLDDFHASDRSYTWERFSEAIQTIKKYTQTLLIPFKRSKSGHRLIF